ncbi:MAG TPA: hypothetical protein VFS56_05545, partial [Gemmatimonadaceae bacterium]|nr:hypothetical protein [Gemmatimonadaceae bacterium]
AARGTEVVNLSAVSVWALAARGSRNAEATTAMKLHGRLRIQLSGVGGAKMAVIQDEPYYIRPAGEGGKD